MDVTLPDGTVIRDVPDGTTRAQLTAKLKANGYDTSKLEPAQEPSIGTRVLQGAGNLAAGAVRGAGSIGATLLAPVDIVSDALAGKGLTLESNRQRRSDMDAGLRAMGADTDSLAYGAGKLGSEIAGTLGVGGALANGLARAPGVAATVPNFLQALRTAGMMAGGGNALTRAAGGAVVGGASAGLVDPEQALAGGAIGGVAPTALKAAGSVGSALGRAARVAPANNALADAAINQYGIPLGLSDISANPLLKAARSVLDDVPLVGRIGGNRKEAVQEGFNRAVGETFGTQGAAKLTPDVMDTARSRLGAEFDRIWNANALTVDQAFMQKLTGLRATADKMPAAEGGSLTREIDDLLSKVATDANGNQVIAGDVANKFQSYLRRRAEGSAGMRYELGDLRQAVIDAFNRSVSPADAAALTTTRGQYKALKTVEPLMQSAEAGVAGRTVGDVPAGLLPNAVRQSYRNGISGSPFEDLSQIGSQYVADRVSRTGGSARAMVQNTLLGGALFTNPAYMAAALPAVTGLEAALASPALARWAAQPGGSNALLQMASNPQARELLLRSAPLVGAPLLNGGR